MVSALNQISNKRTAQSEKAKPNQVKNNAGGYVFKLDDWKKLERFLILGTEGGSYYVGQRELTLDNVDTVRSLLAENPTRVIETAVAISQEGRAHKNSPAIFTIALALVESTAKREAIDAVQKICRTSTHLFEFAQYIENLGGWGRAKREAVANWYLSKTPEQVAYQAVKYRQRNGWTHRDLLRLSHPKLGDNYKPVADFICGRLGLDTAQTAPHVIQGFLAVSNESDAKRQIKLVQEYGLPWEAVPTELHKQKELWRTLFEADSLGQTALLRNVTRLAKLGLFTDLKFAKQYADRLADPERIKKGRLHPISYLNAMTIYEKGTLDRGKSSGYYGYVNSSFRKKDWTNNATVAGALEDGFYNSFKFVKPASKRTMLALDVSGSMNMIAATGLDLTAAQVAAAMAMVTVRTEPYVDIMGFATNFVDLGISSKDSLTTVSRKISGKIMGATDCSQPMVWAKANGVDIDSFMVYTDNETWAGRVHPFQAIKDYRQHSGIDAKLIVAGVSSTGFTIADPADAGMLDIIGFDASAPAIAADFSAGRV